MNTSMTCNDLTSGMRVTYRNGETRLVLACPVYNTWWMARTELDMSFPVVVFTNIPKHDEGGVKNTFCDVYEEYNMDMTHKTEKKWDVVKVEVPKNKFRLLSQTDDDYVTIYKRPEAKKMTVAEIASALGYDVEIVKG
jgi:hypothetical protein